ncbi:MAG: aminoglycoside phosphotransferase family protein [Actinomycetota bacterium]
MAPATRKDGTHAVLKVGMPHFEGEQEIAALRFLDGNPTVRLLQADDELNAMLLERCVPGAFLRNRRAEPEQDVVIAQLLKRFWRAPVGPHAFRPLSEMTMYWSAATLADAERWPDSELVAEGLRLFRELPLTASTPVLLATDLHAGNVLEAQREPWLVIDPKPFVGDPAYDATQHLFNCRGRMRSDPQETIARFADLLDVDAERVRLWMLARCAAEPRDTWGGDSLALARRLA